MKQLLFICLLVLLSCTSGNNYVSIQQIDSKYPITIGIIHDTISYVDFPISFLMNKETNNPVTLLGHGYKSGSSYTLGDKEWYLHGIILYNVNGKIGYSPEGEDWRKLSCKQREYIVFIRYQQLTQEAKTLLKTQIKSFPDSGEVKIGNIQQLRKKNKQIVFGFLKKDSISFTFSHINFMKKYIVNTIYMPVEVR